MLSRCKKGHERKVLPKGTIYCPQCQKDRNIKYLTINREINILRHRVYYNKNKDKLQKYRKDNSDHKKNYDKKYVQKNILKIKNRGIIYYQNNKNNWLKAKIKKHPLRQIWQNMKKRCYNPTNCQYKNYGGRGIRICDQWLGQGGFDCFVKDMYPTWKKGLSIDRYPDNNGNYEPGNCRWATAKQQVDNRRVSISYRLSIPDNSPIYYPFGNLITLKEFAEQVSLPLIIAKYRYAQNWDAEWIINSLDDSRFYDYNRHKYNISELCLLSNLPFYILYNRIVKLNWSIENSLLKPVRRKLK